MHSVLATRGTPLDQGVRRQAERRLGHDLASVRVHRDGGAAASARAVGADAYTVGEQIVFGPGRYAPQSAAGERLLLHELVHVLQARRAPTQATGPLVVGSPAAAEEREANRVAHAQPSIAAPAAPTRRLRRFASSEPAPGAQQPTPNATSHRSTGARGARPSQNSVRPTREQAVAAGLASPARPVGRRERRLFEQALDVDLGDVHIHAGADASRAARSLGAEAFTVGKHIVLGTQAPDPALLHHELAHTLQQPNARPSSRLPDASDGAEREAQTLAARVAGGLAAARPATRPALALARQTLSPGLDWPNWAGHAPLTPQQNQLIADIERRRAAATRNPNLRFSAEPGGPYVSGYAYGGRPGTLAPTASRYLKIAMNEYWALEAGVGGIDTWDTPVRQRDANFSLGPGLLNENVALVMRKWIEADQEAAEFLLFYAGVWVTAAHEFVVVVGRDDIRSGAEARAFLNDPQILSLIIALAESPHGASLDRAEQEWITDRELKTIPAEAATWDDAAIAVCLHIQHGAPAYSWVNPHYRAAYIATNGDPLEIAQVFAYVTNQLGVFHRLGNSVTGPILVTRQWGDYVYGNFSRWGVGGGKPGYLQQAIDTAGIRVVGTRAELGSNVPAGHVLYQTGETKQGVVATDIGPITTHW